MDKRTARVWVKVQLKDDADAKHAGDIVEYWRHFRQAAQHITRAIRMYYSLTQGDTSLLREYFPLIVDKLREGSPIRPSAAEAIQITAAAPPKVERRAKTSDEDKADLLDLF